MTLELPPGEHLYVFGGGGASIVAISPQGDRIAYVAQDTAGVHTYVRRTGELTGRAVAYNAGDLVFSPDGRWLAYSVGAEIRKVSSDGGAVVSIVTDSRLIVRGLAWLRSDTIVIGGFGGLRTVPAAGGTVRVLAGSDTTQNQAYPVVLPDGRTLAFANGQPGARKLALLAPGQARYTQLDVPALAPIGMAEGQLMFVAVPGALMGLPIDLAHQRATGDPTQVEAGIRQTGTGAAMASLSESGTLWYVTGESMGRLILSDASGAGAPLFDDRRLYRYPRFSPDGRKVAVGVTSGPVTDIWVYDRVNRTFQKLTTVGDASTPEWSPDGKHILFRSVQSGKNEIWWLPSDGSGKAEPLYQGEPVNEAVISPDAKWLLYRTSPASKFSRDIFALPLTGSDRKPVLLVGGPSQESHPRLSPDGKWLAYQSNESGRFEVYVRPFPNEGARTQVSTSGGQEPIWSRSGNELYYRTSAGITSTTVTTGATFSIRARKLVLPSGATDDLTHQNYDVSADGRFLTVMASGGGASAILVHNWARELREKLAVGKR
jgi:Tol biopolymer transport system component